MNLTPGQRIGTYYVVEELIGTGGMATVYRARHAVLESRHAIKLLMPHLAARQELRLRFLEEGKIQARLRHRHMVPVTDLINEAGAAGLVMSWLDGSDLRDHLSAHGPFSAAQATRLTLQALDALALVHSHGVIHRDLKPGNLFLEALPRGQTQLRVMDFGIAKVVDKQRTKTAQHMGSTAYMSPEQIKSPREVDPRSDLFSLGAVLFEMLAGAPAFDAETDYELMRRITSGEHAPLPGPPALQPILRRALQVSPEDRFPDAAAFAAALRALEPDPLRDHRHTRLRARAAALAVPTDRWPAQPDDAWLTSAEQELDATARKHTRELTRLRDRLAAVEARPAPPPAPVPAPVPAPEPAPKPKPTPMPAPAPMPAPMPAPAPVVRTREDAAVQVELEDLQRQLQQTRQREQAMLLVGAAVFLVGLFVSAC